MAGDQACQNVHKARYAMTGTTTIPAFHPPGSITDPLTGIARDGARQMLAAAITAAAANVVAFSAMRFCLTGVSGLSAMAPGPSG